MADSEIISILTKLRVERTTDLGEDSETGQWEYGVLGRDFDAAIDQIRPLVENLERELEAAKADAASWAQLVEIVEQYTESQDEHLLRVTANSGCESFEAALVDADGEWHPHCDGETLREAIQSLHEAVTGTKSQEKIR